MINVDSSAEIEKIIMCAKKIIFGILLHVLVKMVKIQSGSIINDSVITRDEIINAADSVSTNVPTNATKTVSTNVTSIASINILEDKIKI